MIYLFEDRKGRQEIYLKKQLDKEFLISSSIDCKKNNLPNYLSENFSCAKAVLFHSSYSFTENEITKEDIKKFFVEKKIPFVYFSGGLNNNLVIENGIINGNVNSGDMYYNLPSFLDYYKMNQKINIPLLIYGEKYILNSLLELQLIISNYLFLRINNYKLSLADLDEIIDLIDARIKEDELKEDKSKLLEWLNQERKGQKLNKKILLSQIQKLINKY